MGEAANLHICAVGNHRETDGVWVPQLWRTQQTGAFITTHSNTDSSDTQKQVEVWEALGRIVMFEATTPTA